MWPAECWTRTVPRDRRPLCRGQRELAGHGPHYAGPGATIGPAMVFAYLAVEDIVNSAV